MDTRAKRVVAVTLAAVVASAAGGIPTLMLKGSTEYFESAPCGSADAPRAPSAEFYAQIERLDRLARLPWTGAAAGVATNGAHACLEVFSGECASLRDDAVDAARAIVNERMRGTSDAGEAGTHWHTHLDEEAVVALCNDWSGWRSWLASEGLDAAGACPLCAEVP